MIRGPLALPCECPSHGVLVLGHVGREILADRNIISPLLTLGFSVIGAQQMMVARTRTARHALRADILYRTEGEYRIPIGRSSTRPVHRHRNDAAGQHLLRRGSREHQNGPPLRVPSPRLSIAPAALSILRVSGW